MLYRLTIFGGNAMLTITNEGNTVKNIGQPSRRLHDFISNPTVRILIFTIMFAIFGTIALLITKAATPPAPNSLQNDTMISEQQ